MAPLLPKRALPAQPASSDCPHTPPPVATAPFRRGVENSCGACERHARRYALRPGTLLNLRTYALRIEAL
eukprot:3422659-Alexandrium_andersonii.AAC.1